MVDDPGHGNVGLVGILAVQVVAANPHAESAGGLAADGKINGYMVIDNTFYRGHLPVTAVTGSDDSVGGDQGASAHEGAPDSAPEEGDLVRELSD